MERDLDYGEHADEGVSKGSLVQLSGLALEQKHLEEEVVRIEEQLKSAQAKLRDVNEVRLPTLMDTVGMDRFTTSEGFQVQIIEKFHAKIPEANLQKAFTYLESTGDAGIIKHVFTIEFGKLTRDQALAFKRVLEDLHQQFKEKEYVHHSTLAAYCKERYGRSDGGEFPMELFGAYRRRVSKIKV